MLKIEQLVEAAILAGSMSEFPMGMSMILPAVEATARKALGKNKVNRKEYKKFLRDQYPIIEAFIGAGLNLEETVFPTIELDTDGGKRLEAPDLADLIYHAFRCCAAHGHELNEKFAFTHSETQGESSWITDPREGRINMPDKILWSLIAVVVFSEANKDISTRSNLHLTWGGKPVEREPPYRFDVDVFWGGEGVVRNFLSKRNLIRVAVKN